MLDLAGRVKSFFAPRSSSPSGEIAPSAPLSIYRYVPGELRLSREQMQTLSTVYACIRVIAEHTASSPIRVLSRDGSGRRTYYAYDSLVSLLNQRPHHEISAQAFREALVAQALTWGNAYAVIDWDGAGRLRALRPLLSRDVSCVRRDDGTLVYRVGDLELDPLDVIHVRGLTIEGLTGASTLAYAARAIATAYAAETYGQEFFANGATPSGVIISEKTLTKEAGERLAESWAATHGPGKRHGTAVLPGGADYKTIASTAKDAQLQELRSFSTEDVARYFGVPLVLLGVQQAAQGYGTNVAQLGLQFARAGLTPWCRRIEQEISYKIFGAYGSPRVIEHDLSWITQGSWLEQSQAVETQVRSGVCTIDEGRELLGRDPLPGGAGNSAAPATRDPRREDWRDDPTQ
jgi:HK97 family phage portal protein